MATNPAYCSLQSLWACLKICTVHDKCPLAYKLTFFNLTRHVRHVYLPSNFASRLYLVLEALQAPAVESFYCLAVAGFHTQEVDTRFLLSQTLPRQQSCVANMLLIMNFIVLCSLWTCARLRVTYQMRINAMHFSMHQMHGVNGWLY